uniref:Formin homology 2 domain containing 3b n=2 Tax=Oncorhynchus TaxID=8016 RepID=A0AAZ3R1G8_ONCTS
MATFVCRVQFLDDTDPFNSTNFPEPTRPPHYTFREDIPLINQIAGVHRLLRAPHKVCNVLILPHLFYSGLMTRGKKHSVVLRTQLTVRVHACIEKLYNSNGRDLRRALFSLKQIFQDDKDLVHEFVMAEGLTCLIKVGAEADQNYQNYILRALGQIMLYVDGMNGVICHIETVQWLYALIGSKFRLVVKTALKLLLVFVEYSESNASLLIEAVTTVDTKRGCKQWSNAMEILDEKDGVDTELLVYGMTLINKTLSALPDQDSFYDMVDGLEDQRMEAVAKRFLGRRGTDLDLMEQLNIYEATLRHEDGDDESNPPTGLSGLKDRRRASFGDKRRGLERRRSRRASLGRSGNASPCSPSTQHSGFQPFKGQGGEDMSKRSSLGGLLSSSYRQHQESLSAERERRRAEREERLQRIEREERNKHSRDYVDKMEEDFTACLEEKEAEVVEEEREEPETEEVKEETKAGKEGEEEEVREEEEVLTSPEKEEEREDGEEDSGILSDKERQNEEVNEKDNCSASSISSAGSTLEREERGSNENGPWTQSVKEVDVNEQCSKILNSKRFMLDMLYSQNKEPCEEDEEEERGKEKGVGGKANQEAVQPSDEGEESTRKTDFPEKKESHSNVRVFAERFGDLVKGLGSPPTPLNSPSHEAAVVEQEKPPPPPPKKESDTIWDQLLASPRELRIGDIDFTDLKEEDDEDILNAGLMGVQTPCVPLLPHPLTLTSHPAPHPCWVINLLVVVVFQVISLLVVFQDINLLVVVVFQVINLLVVFQVRPSDYQYISSRSSGDSLWFKLEPVKIDTSKLEHLFQTKSKEIPVTKKTAADGKRQEVIVLDSKRSNAINIGLTVLPPPRTIKTAILNFDEYALNKEGIEKILTMIPSEEEKQKIQEAQLANPDVPLGSAEQFLLTLSSISELSARLQLWAFKMDYEATEKEVAEPLQDVKEGMEQLEKNKTLRYILSTLLAIGNFLNGTNAKGFELSYLEKVPEVKDTVHKQSLLHHACSIVVDHYPQSTDLYSEIGAITRSAKVDFDQLQDNLTMMERRCKASWDHLKVMAKHEMKPTLKQKMSDFLKDCAERIIILKIVHRRIINRFHVFLLYLGHPAYGVREISVHRFSKILSEFALEYRTTRDRVLQQKQKRADHRERNKTRGKMIMDVNAPSLQPQGLGHAEDAAEHEFMKAVLKTSLQGGNRETSGVPGLRTRTRSRPGRGGTDTPRDDEADEIMDRIVRSATQGPSQRAVPRERRRSRANRKSRMSSLTHSQSRLISLTHSTNHKTLAARQLLFCPVSNSAGLE